MCSLCELNFKREICTLIGYVRPKATCTSKPASAPAADWFWSFNPPSLSRVNTALGERDKSRTVDRYEGIGWIDCVWSLFSKKKLHRSSLLAYCSWNNLKRSPRARNQPTNQISSDPDRVLWYVRWNEPNSVVKLLKARDGDGCIAAGINCGTLCSVQYDKRCYSWAWNSFLVQWIYSGYLPLQCSKHRGWLYEVYMGVDVAW